MLRYKIVDIQLTEHTTVRRTVPVWELEVIRAVHSNALINVVGETLVKRDPPDPESEFARLAKRYHNGKPEDGSPEEVSFAAKVYGSYGIGNARLAQAIADATMDVPEPNDGYDDLIGNIPSFTAGG